MKTFLDKVIHRITEDFKEISKVHIVLPSKRACLYFKDRLIKSGYRSAWLPKIETLNDFVENAFPGKIVNKLTLISILYDNAKRLELKEADSFDTFYKWGAVLLNDFNAINSYGIEGKDLYKNLRDIEVLERWSFSNDQWTETQESFNDFWMKQGDLYTLFIKDLEKANMASSAMALRWLLDNLGVLSDILNDNPIVFAGFNALHKAEQKLISEVFKVAETLFLVDNDDFFVSGRREAGYFYRQLKSQYNWKGLNDLEESFANSKKQIDIISVNQRSSIGLVNSKVLKDKKSFENTCVVLGDETLLESVLTSLPDEVDSINVTMGYKLRNTPAYDLFISLFALQLRMKKKNKEVYHKDLLRFLNHPYIIMLLGEQLIRKTKEKILEQNLIYINKEKLLEIENSNAFDLFFSLILSPWKDFPKDPTNTMVFLIDAIVSKVDGEEHPLIIEYLFHLKKGLLQLSNHLEKFTIDLGLKSYKTLFSELINSEKLSFHGEPLEGLQLMGLLESRALDFEHVILLSVNEGVIPKTTLTQTFIPWDLRVYYGLPGKKEQDALYSYYFYRLIQRAKKVTIVYNTNSGKDLSSVEPSRYIKQLHYYKDQGLIDFSINEYQAKLDSLPNPSSVLSINRDEFYKDKLKSKLQKSLSPTALSTYLNCPLDFYFKYILNLREGDEVDEEMGADVFGSIIHNTLEELYKPYIHAAPNFIQIRSELKRELDISIKAELNNRWTKTGVNRMNIQIIETLVNRFIDLDEKFIEKCEASGASFTIEKIEEALSRKIEVDIGNEKIEVNLKGLADRIDKTGNTVRIIDYKTGKVDKLSNVEIQKVFEDKNLSKPLQLLMYQAMYDDFSSKEVDVGIIGFRDLSKYMQSVKLKKGQGEIKEEFYKGLDRLINSMFNDESKIEHNPDSTWCKFCEIH